MAEDTTRSQPRRTMLLIIIAVLIFIAIVAAGLNYLSRSSRLNQQLADLRSRGLLTNAEELHAFYAVPSDVRDTTEQWTAPTKAITNANIGLKVQGFPIIGVGPMPEGRCDWSGLGIGEI